MITTNNVIDHEKITGKIGELLGESIISEIENGASIHDEIEIPFNIETINKNALLDEPVENIYRLSPVIAKNVINIMLFGNVGYSKYFTLELPPNKKRNIKALFSRLEEMTRDIETIDDLIDIIHHVDDHYFFLDGCEFQENVHDKCGRRPPSLDGGGIPHNIFI
jgi:hypothetical protein